jgi:hypothetical protein
VKQGMNGRKPRTNPEDGKPQRVEAVNYCVKPLVSMAVTV